MGWGEHPTNIFFWNWSQMLNWYIFYHFYIDLDVKNDKNLLLSRVKRVTLYLRSSFSMMYPTGPQLNTQGFPELFGGGGGGDFVRWT